MVKVSTSDQKEYRAWCTRRLTGVLLERLELGFEKEVDTKQIVPQETRREVARIKHGDQVQEKAFEKPFESEPVDFPLGEDGILITGFTEQPGEGGALALSLKGGAGKGFTINLDDKLRHQFYELLNRACERAKWFDNTVQSSKPVVH